MLGCEGVGGVRRWLTLGSGLVECLGFAGAVFGWASLVFVLKAEGYFSLLCVNDTTRGNSTQGLDCGGQDEQFSLVFTIACFLNSFLLLPAGFLFDRYGTMVTRVVGTSLYTTGTLLVALSSAALSSLLFPALPFIAVGGMLLLISNMQVGNLFGCHRSTVITLYNGAFDSSAAVFLFIKLLFEAGISLRASFLFLSACGVIHLARTFLLLPRKHIPYPLPEGYTYGMSCGRRETASPEAAAQGGLQDSAVTEVTHFTKENARKEERSFRECVLSRFFMFHLVWLSVIQLRHYLFVSTLNPMLQRLTEDDSSQVSRYINVFAVVQLCGVLFAPLNGLIMDRHKGQARAPGETEAEADLRSSVLSLSLTGLQCVLFSLCAASPLLPLQYLSFLLQVINRSFLYGGNATFISLAFPACHFGKLYGLMLGLSAVVALLQYPCFILTQGALGGDPLYLNIAMVLFSLLAFIHPVNVYLHCHGLAALRAKTKTTLTTS